MGANPIRPLMRDPQRPWRRMDTMFKVFGSFTSSTLTTGQYTDLATYTDLHIPNANSNTAATTRPYTGAQRTSMKAINPRLAFMGYTVEGGVASDAGYVDVTADSSTDIFTAPAGVPASTNNAPNWDTGTQVKISGTTAPTGITLGTSYWLVSVTATGFKLSTTQSGSAINLTSNGSADLQAIDATDLFSLPPEAYYRGGLNWAGTTSYVVGNVVRPTTDNEHLYLCTVAGTSGAGEPTWPTARRSVVQDGGVLPVTWQEYEPVRYGHLCYTATGGGYALVRPWHPATKTAYINYYQARFNAFTECDAMMSDVMGPSVSDSTTTYLVPLPYIAGTFRKVGWDAEGDNFKLMADRGAHLQDAFWGYGGQNIPIGLNCIDSGPAYFGNDSGTNGSTSVIATGGVRFAWCEQWFRGIGSGASLTVYPTLAVVRNCIDMMIDLDGRGILCGVSVNLWASTEATFAQSKQWHKYSYACFIIGNPGNAFFQFRDDSPNCGTAASQAAYDADVRKGRHNQYSTNYYVTTDASINWYATLGENLGQPKDFWASCTASEISSGVPRRRFTNGFCIANANTSGTYNYAPTTDGMPAGTYKDIDGTSYTFNTGSDTIGVAFNNGYILVKQ